MPFVPKQCVVVPIDFSSSSATAVHTALEFTSDPANVHVIHVIPSLNPVSPSGIWGDADVEKQLCTTAQRHLDTFIASLEVAGVTTAIEIGQAGNRIVEYADEHSADLIVIPSHGHSGLKRAFLGSVAERVIRHARCATLVLRRDDGE
ncbi:MAG: universal stress protein [Planctomycetaceae bacterium]